MSGGHWPSDEATRRPSDPWPVPALSPVVTGPPPWQPDLWTALGVHGINYGCGPNLLSRWLNTDVGPLSNGQCLTEPGVLYRVGSEGTYFLRSDARGPNPVTSGSFRWARSDHMVEHLRPVEALAWLQTVRAVLRPAGILRITTPDLARYARAYADRDQPFFDEHAARLGAMGWTSMPPRPAFMLNQIFLFWRHRWLYDYGELKLLLSEAGFYPEHIAMREYLVGEDRELASFDPAIRSDESLYVEARA